METHEPLTMTDALAVWEREVPQLFVATVNHIRRASLARNSARKRLLTDVDFHADIVQETGISFFLAVEKHIVWRNEATHWLACVNKRIARRAARRESRLVSLSDYLSNQTGDDTELDAVDIPGIGPSPEEITSAREEGRRILSACPYLSEAQRRTLNYLLEEATPAEIAAAENIEEGTARKRVHDLRSRLSSYRN